MKKLWIPIVMFCYLALSCGVVVNHHFCMNRLASTELYSTGSDVCSKCGMESDDTLGCCHDEVQVLKMDDDQKTAQLLVYDFSITISPAEIISDYLSVPFYDAGETLIVNNHSPPILAAQEIYLRNGVFRI